MGWASGSEVMIDIIKAVKPNVKDKKARKKIYEIIISALENWDWDTQDEAMDIDPVYDKIIKERNPTWFDNENS